MHPIIQIYVVQKRAVYHVNGSFLFLILLPILFIHSVLPTLLLFDFAPSYRYWMESTEKTVTSVNGGWAHTSGQLGLEPVSGPSCNKRFTLRSHGKTWNTAACNWIRRRFHSLSGSLAQTSLCSPVARYCDWVRLGYTRRHKLEKKNWASKEGEGHGVYKHT